MNSVDIEEQTRDLCGCRIDTEGYGLRRMLTYPAKSEWHRRLFPDGRQSQYFFPLCSPTSEHA